MSCDNDDVTENQTSPTETGAEFAARYWGGDNAVLETRPADRGARDVDGGRPRYPAGWQFTADCATYRVWQTRDKVWHMAVGYDGFATFVQEGDEWVVTAGWSGDVSRHAVRSAAPSAPAEAEWDANDDTLANLGYAPQMCECELDWNCPLHQGGYTALERQNDAWASQEQEPPYDPNWVENIPGNW